MGLQQLLDGAMKATHTEFISAAFFADGRAFQEPSE